MRAPVIVVLVAVAGAAYFAGRATRNDQHELDQQRISFLQDQITAYKDRLQGATPDQAAKRFSTLETALATANRKIGRFMPDTKRHLTDADKAFIKTHAAELKKILPSPIELFGMSFGDSIGYASDFSDEFKANGIQAADPIAAPCSDDQDGILVGMKDASKPPANALRFISLLTDMGMHPSPTRWYNAPDDTAFDLFICPEATNPPTASPPSPAPPASPPGR